MDRLMGGGEWSRPWAESELSVPLDVHETDSEYRVEASLPGIKPEDVRISTNNNMVTIEGERKEAHERKEGERTTFTEHRYGSFSRSFTLPTAVNAEQAQAEFHDGVLCITLPKSEAARPRQIPIQGSSMTGDQERREHQQVQAQETPVQPS